MSGLRVYTEPANTNLSGDDNVFYSRRGDGPYYRWRYEENGGKWRFARVLIADFTPHELSMASWKAVPVALQARLIEHYLE
jgi:hypothetical protein